MKSICGANCDECEMLKSKKCEGCTKSKGCPFGKKCFIANYIELGGKEQYEVLKKNLTEEINSITIEGMPNIEELYPLNGAFVNLEYQLPNGKKTKFLDENDIYLGTQVECIFNDDEMKRCFGVIANMNFIMICEYGENGSNPELLIYKKR